VPFVDSNIFVYHLTADPVHGQKAKKILENIQDGEKCATSTLIITQVCSYLKWKKKHEAIPIFLSFLKHLTSLDKVETTVLDFEEARSAQSALKLSWSMWNDIVIAAQMKRLKMKEIYSNDNDFDNIQWVKRLF